MTTGAVGMAFDKFIAEKGVKEAVGVEIGVWRGEHAEHLIKTAPNIKRLYLVDPYDIAQEYRKCEAKMPDWDDNKGWLDARLAAWRLFKDDPKVTISPFRSSELASEFADESLDFVYIDANHEYEFASEDIGLWYPKVKKGGVFGGHDYDLPGVNRAIKEFLETHNQKLLSEKPDWFVVV